MIKYDILKNRIASTNQWNSESDFFCDVIAKSTIQLFDYCYEDLERGNFIRILPLLRQIQENCVALLGLGTDSLSAKEFVEGKIDPPTIINRIIANSNEDKEKVAMMSDYMRSIKNVLNKYSHTNLDGLMLLFLDEHQTYDTRRYNKIALRFVISMVEILFIPEVNHLYKVKIELPSFEDIRRELKDIGNLRYTADSLPEGYKEFFNHSELLKDYFKNMISGLKTQFIESKDLLHRKENSNGQNSKKRAEN